MFGQRVGLLDDVEREALLVVAALGGVGCGGGIRAAPRDCRRRGERCAARQRGPSGRARGGRGARGKRVGFARGDAHGASVGCCAVVIRGERGLALLCSPLFFFEFFLLVFRDSGTSSWGRRGEEKIHSPSFFLTSFPKPRPALLLFSALFQAGALGLSRGSRCSVGQRRRCPCSHGLASPGRHRRGGPGRRRRSAGARRHRRRDARRPVSSFSFASLPLSCSPLRFGIEPRS